MQPCSTNRVGVVEDDETSDTTAAGHRSPGGVIPQRNLLLEPPSDGNRRALDDDLGEERHALPHQATGGLSSGALSEPSASIACGIGDRPSTPMITPAAPTATQIHGCELNCVDTTDACHAWTDASSTEPADSTRERAAVSGNGWMPSTEMNPAPAITSPMTPGGT